MTRILIAPNAFKNSLTATAAADSICKGLMQSKLQCSCKCFPVGDGGDGTAELIIQHFNGEIITAEVHDPLGRKIISSFGMIDQGNTAVIEMADASGLRLLKPDELDPLHVTTFGTGELIKAALDKDVSKIIMCIGGSATVDGGAGLLHALGVRFMDRNGKELSDIPETLVDLAGIDTSSLDKRVLECAIVVLCDVENKLLGKNGAAEIFGPQKGAKPDDVGKLEASLAKLKEVAYAQTGYDMGTVRHGGAAGGTAAGVAAFLKAKLANGIDYFLEITGFEDELKKADLVITGEGSIDEQTLHGKGPFGVALKAKEQNLPVIGLAGKIPQEVDANFQKYFDVLLAIGHEPDELSKALPLTDQNLVRTSKAIGDLLACKENIQRGSSL